MGQQLLRLNGEVWFVYHGTPRYGRVEELRPEHNMVLVRVGEGQFRNFKIDKMSCLSNTAPK